MKNGGMNILQYYKSIMVNINSPVIYQFYTDVFLAISNGTCTINDVLTV